MKEKITCAYCDGVALLKKEKKEIKYRKDVFTILAHFYQCESCKERFTNNETDTISLLQVHNQYREKYHIPFPDEIADIRNTYGLSASKMSEVLGLGANGYSNYENGEIPTPAIGNLLSAAAEGTTFLQLVNKANTHFSENALKKINERIQELIAETQQKESIYQLLNSHTNPGHFTGFKKINPIKIAALVTYFIQHAKPAFNDKLKLNKLLFFLDFHHFKSQGVSISGLSYRAIQYGPVPSQYDNIYRYLENEQIISAKFLRMPNGAAREVFVSNSDFDEFLFSDTELATITHITKQFSNTPTWHMVELSHKEKAWKELASQKAFISFQQYAFDLKSV